MDYLLEDVAFVRAELSARCLTVPAVADAIGVVAKTLRNHLTGQHPLTAANARLLRAHLDDFGPWHDLRARDVLVTLGSQPTPQETQAFIQGAAPDRKSSSVDRIQPLQTVPFPFDTVVLNIDVPKENRDNVASRVPSTGRRGPNIGAKCRHQVAVQQVRATGRRSGGTMIVAWDPYSRTSSWWMRVQFHPGLRGHTSLVRRLLRAASTGYLWPEGPSVSVERVDAFVDVGVPIGTIFPMRPRARTYRRVESIKGAETLYVGSRESKVFVRCYDAAAHHGLQGEVTRIEVETKPRKALALWGEPALDDFGAKLRALRMHLCHAPGLTVQERALLMLARRDGVAHVRAALRREGAGRLRAFDGLLKRAQEALPMFDVAEHLGGMWPLGLWLLRDRLRWGSGWT